MTFLAPAIPSLVSAGLSFGANKLFGGSSGSAQAPLTNFKAGGINAGGLASSWDENSGTVNITPSAERLGLVKGIADRFGLQAADLAALRSSVAPGISELRATRLGEIENARTAAVGNLRENLQRRRVLGSSFGQDAITRAESEFGEAKSKVAAESFLQEFEMTQQLVEKEHAAWRAQFQTGLDELNLETEVALKISGKATEQLGANARALAALNAKEAEGAGKFFGQTFEPVAKSFGSMAGDLFKSISPSGGGGSLGFASPSVRA